MPEDKSKNMAVITDGEAIPESPESGRRTTLVSRKLHYHGDYRVSQPVMTSSE